MFTFGWALGVACGGALVWFCKDPLIKYYKGAEDYVGYLKDKIEKIK